MQRLFSVVRIALPGLVAASLSTACVTTKEEGQLMQRDISKLREDHRTAKDSTTERTQALDNRLKALEERGQAMATAQQELDERNNRNKADFGQELASLQQEVAALKGGLETKEYQLKERELQLGASQGQVAMLDLRIKELEQKVVDLQALAAKAAEAKPAAAPAADDPPKTVFPNDKQALYDFAKKQFDDGKFPLCREGFEKFQKNFPKDKELMDNAHFWIGECHFSEKHFDKAILSYQKVITDFPKSEKADAALYKMGQSFSALGYDDDARVFYDELLQKYPKSTLFKDAKLRLDELLAKKKKKAPAPGKKK